MSHKSSTLKPTKNSPANSASNPSSTSNPTKNPSASDTKPAAKRASDAQPAAKSTPKFLLPIILCSVALVAVASFCVIYGLSSGDAPVSQSSSLHDGENLITTGGTYTFSGSADGSIHVIAPNAEVEIILDGVDLTNDSGPALYIEKAASASISLLGDNALTSAPTEDLDSALLSKVDLTLSGSDDATLTITSTNDAISAKKTSAINILSGTYHLSAADDAVHTKGTLTISGGTIDITQSNEGLEANIVNIPIFS